VPADDVADPGAAGVDQHPGAVVSRAGLGVLQRDRQRSPSRVGADTPCVRVRISAPRASASRAFSTTSRESSTQQSEYSKALNRSCSGAPSGAPRSSVPRARQDLPPAQVS
jgi:hypothetical protein